MQYKDYYEILGVNKNSSAAEIKAAYRKLARKYHPDVNKEKGSSDKFKDINESYEVLSDKDKRARYDQLGSSWQGGADFTPPPGYGDFDFSQFSRGSSAGSGGFSDFFSAIFGDLMNQNQGATHRHNFGDYGSMGAGQAQTGQRAGARQQAKPQNLDSTQDLILSLKELNDPKNTSKTVTLTSFQKCPYCSGGQFCSNCSGTGVIKKTRTISVKIPRPIKPGQKIRLSGEGKADDYGNRGDLFLIIKIKDKEYEISGLDIIKEIEITPQEAVLGTKKEVETPFGKITATIPAQTTSGKTLRYKGLGLVGAKEEKGNLNLRTKIVLPQKLSDKEIALYKQLFELETQSI